MLSAGGLKADTVGFQVGANIWQQSFSGKVLADSNSTNTIDIEDDLAYDDEQASNFYVALEHPIPLLPNIRLAQTEIDVSEASTFNRNIDFDGEIYNVNEEITSSSDLSHTDVTLYYELLDNWISLDVGITARIFSEGFNIQSLTTSSGFELDETLPLVYLATKFDLPLSGLYVGAHANVISYDGNSIVDYSINLGYETKLGLGIEAGFRSLKLDYEEDSDDEAADITIDGGYVGLFYHF
ncbi:MAG: outer membrane protein [Oceanicoccus sp.]|jgi:outer membrane protein